MKQGDKVIVNQRNLPPNTAATVDIVHDEAKIVTVKLADGRVFAVAYHEVVAVMDP